jgi:hypothetical protein
MGCHGYLFIHMVYLLKYYSKFRQNLVFVNRHLSLYNFYFIPTCVTLVDIGL